MSRHSSNNGKVTGTTRFAVNQGVGKGVFGIELALEEVWHLFQAKNCWLAIVIITTCDWLLGGTHKGDALEAGCCWAVLDKKKKANNKLATKQQRVQGNGRNIYKETLERIALQAGRGQANKYGTTPR